MAWLFTEFMVLMETEAHLPKHFVRRDIEPEANALSLSGTNLQPVKYITLHY